MTNNVLLPAITGTSLMTLFSHLVSDIENKNFSEPILLAALIEVMFPAGKKQHALTTGWISHYAAGVLFTLAYRQWKDSKNPKQHSFVRNGFLLGALSGAAGIAIWQTVLALHPDPPGIHKRKYFTQLFIAHLIYGLTVTTTEKALVKKEL